MRYSVVIMMLILLSSLLLLAQETKADKANEPDFKNWKVDHQYGDADTVALSLEEGTWMNLDVSPDGKLIVFDLLGDIFTLPISGGKAKLIAGGLSYDVQPKFSPDGQKISFTSDRSGGDNIWIMDRDGGNPEQVTDESFRLLNNATWTPDGQYLIARKHFTSRRSLGAGEMWMYHLSGGKGVQLTERRNDQQDAGEPEISPDGRYLYYSEDMSPGGFFQYNKDPYGQIYVVRRLDMETGKLMNYITGAGGAIRPEVSPDGKQIAFVRRVRQKTVLFIRDIATGEEWPVYDGLSRDQQETWAIFGVYPNYAWMPAGKEIVVWAKGKLRRIDIATRSATIIPFQADLQISMARAARFQQQVGPIEFQPKMIRHAATSSDGKWLVFNAAGHLWKKKLPKGKISRLVEVEGQFEFQPSFSPDNEWVVYTTWNPAKLGSIQKVRINGGQPQQLTKRKGYYYSPRYAPDGTMVVFQRGTGNSVLGFSHGTEPGIYWVAANGGDANLIIEEGSRPSFNQRSDRIYFMSREGGKKALKSCQLDGHDLRTIFTSNYATDIAISPDENWVAFQELFNVFLSPFPKAGTAIDLSAKTTAIPVKKVSRDAGISLHWSGDARELHWVLGPTYYTRSLKNSFDFVEGAPDSIPGPEETGIELEFYVETDIPDGSLALTGARIISMKGDEVIENGTILVKKNRIWEIGPAANINIPKDAKIVDLQGKTIMPGIVDVHAHMGHWSGGISTPNNWSYMANLAYGVTTTHDPSANTEMVFSQSEIVEAGEMIGPRIFSTGTILYGAEGDFKAVVNSLEDARSHLRRMKAVGAFSVKSYNQPRRDQRQQVMQAARELEINVYPEGGSFFYHNLNMILDGHPGIEHSIPIAPVYDDVFKLWAASKTGYTPTLNVAFGGLWGENYWYHHSRVWENRRLLTFTPRPLVDSRSRRRPMAADDDYNHIRNAAVAKRLSDVGVKVNLGSHGQVQGLGSHWELWSFVQGGMSEMEALRTATWNGAYYIGMDKDLGSLEVGKLADLIVLDKNPLDDIYNTEAIRYVMKNGRLYDAATLNEIGNHPKERLPFYWEDPRSSDGFVWRQGLGFGEAHCGCFSHP